MALFTKTLVAGVNVFGAGPSNKWGQAVSPYTFTWGSTKWGEGESLPIQFIKVITGNNIAASSTIATIKRIIMVVGGSIPIAGQASSESLKNGSWNYVFVPSSTNAEDRVSTSWSAGSVSTTSYTCQAAGTTIWT